MAEVPLAPLQALTNPQGTGHSGYQGMAQVSNKPLEKAAATLLIRHLPEAIPDDTLSRLFTHYGASDVRRCTSGRVRNGAFVDFSNEAVASQALHQLNGLRFLGKVLSVERASKPPDSNNNQQNKPQFDKDSTSLVKDATMTKDLKEGFESTSSQVNEPIAKRLGVDYPFPPQLEYVYPPPDGNILNNIVNALIAVPRFYTQVLHLMNKMNIPAPFRAALPTPPLPPPMPAPSPPRPPPPVDANSRLEDLSSSESEMESSDDEGVGARRSARPKRKRAKREAIVGPAVDKNVAHEAVGLKPAVLVPKEIPMIRKKNPMLQIKIAPKQSQSEQKDDGTTEDLEGPEDEIPNLKPFATPEELELGKLAPEKIFSTPMFKNYNAGDPDPVLYIKNLAKDFVEDDFYYIFGSLFGSIEAAKANLSFKLMQEGRMRGQAFVTFPSVELADRALRLVNTFVFKDKPMIIQFRRKPDVPKSN